MSYKEKDFQTDFSRWVKRVWGMTGAFELKVSTGLSLPFSAVKDHQVAALLLAEGQGIVYKIPDDSIGQKPFDAFCLANSQSWVVVMFRSRDRGQKEFFMIPIGIWIKEIESSNRKSLTEERARVIGIRASIV